jgi:hypothetical protein
MPKLTVTVPHSLAQDEALSRIKEAIAQAKSQHSANVNDLQEQHLRRASFTRSRPGLVCLP